MLMHGNYLPLGQYSQSMIPSHIPYDVKEPSSQLMKFPETDLRLPRVRKQIGKLTYEERQRKIERYRAKRTSRVWKKRISYSCRKRVADKRIRIKGRFVSKEEAQNIEKSIKNSNDESEIKSENQVKQIFKIVPNS